MKYSDDELLSGTLKRDFRAIARLITRLEGGSSGARTLAARLRRPQGRAHVVGVTGAPGSGKSTLVDQMARLYRRSGKSVAILAVDPSSPFSGGAILGDRIRMALSAEDPTIFIRSMATRGSLGGLAKATLESVHVLDCAGFDLIIVETVGVGQAEVDIVRTADTCLVVLVPGMGDSVQIIKAGLMEIADVFVVNKSDRDGALALEKDLLTLLSLTEGGPDQWHPKIIRTVATVGDGIEAVQRATDEHVAWLDRSAQGRARRISVISQMLVTLASEWIAQKALRDAGAKVRELAESCVARQRTPLEAVEQLVTWTQKAR